MTFKPFRFKNREQALETYRSIALEHGTASKAVLRELYKFTCDPENYLFDSSR